MPFYPQTWDKGWGSPCVDKQIHNNIIIIFLLQWARRGGALAKWIRFEEIFKHFLRIFESVFGSI